jgi:hypothetical protein
MNQGDLMQTGENIKVGKPDTSPSKSAHINGVREGNETGNLEREPGFVTHEDGKLTTATPRRSTGVGAGDRTPIDPRMPGLFPP